MNEIINDFDKILLMNNYNEIEQNIVKLYYKIGKFLQENNILYVHNILYSKYGLLIGFTRRNLKNIKKFYEVYKDYDISILSKISWDNHLVILKQKNKEELIDYCLKYNIDKNNLRKIIAYGFNLKYVTDEKKSNDVVTLEIISLISSNN